MRRERVVVAMSGGVDSSLTAALLKERGYEVIGITMQIWPVLDPDAALDYGGCCSVAAVEDARRVASLLDIPHYVLNFREVFAERVIRYFAREYEQGRTPNPCLVCNLHVKFERLLEKAFQIEARYLATGHYARVERGTAGQQYVLKKGLDPLKDQSYALYGLNQYQLHHVLFPLGNHTKAETRSLAREFGLPVAEKPESQEICFVVAGDYRSFLEKEAGVEARPGPLLDTAGHRLGTHRGLPHYTVGQRRGLGLAAGYPLYVVALDPERNAVIVGREEELYGSELVAENVNMISGEMPGSSFPAQAKIRYRAEEAPAVVTPLADGRVHVAFREPQRAITPGQAVVFYEDDVVLGGGIIAARLNGQEKNRPKAGGNAFFSGGRA